MSINPSTALSLCGTGILPVRMTGWKPVPHRRRLRRAVTLAELIIAMIITSMLALGVASILYAASYGTSSRREVRRIAVRSQQLRTRIGDGVRNSRAVLASGVAVNGNKYLVLWKGDSNSDDKDQVNLSELMMIEWVASSEELIACEAASPPAPDTVYAAGTDFHAAMLQARTDGDVTDTYWSQGITAIDFTLDQVTPALARKVTWDVTMADQLLSETIVGTGSLRSYAPPE